MKKNLEFKKRIDQLNIEAVEKDARIEVFDRAVKNLRYKAQSLEIGLCISVALLIAAVFKIFIS